MKPQLLAVLVLALAGGLAHGEERTVRFLGYAYDLESGKYLYTEAHERHFTGERWVSGTTRYFAPDGAELGRKAVDFSSDPFLPVYRLELADGYVEGIKEVADAITLIRRQRRVDTMETDTVRRDGLMAADAGFPLLLLAHFDELMRGDTVRFRIVAVSRFDSFKFRARRIADAMIDDQPAACFEAEVDSMLKLFAQPLRFTFDPKTRRLLEYRGPSNLHDPVTGKAYDVRIVYAAKPPKDAGKLPSI